MRSPYAPPGGSLTGLVMNLRGVERAIAAEVIDDIGMVIPASDAFAQRNQGMTVDAACEKPFESLSGLRRREKLPAHHRRGLRLSLRRDTLESCVALAERFGALGSGSLAGGHHRRSGAS